MIDKYILKDGKAVKEGDLKAWSQWFETADRSLKRTETKNGYVSTVFLAMDHRHGGGPLLWETMIFGGEHDQFQERYATKEDALSGHERAVRKVGGSDSMKIKLFEIRDRGTFIPAAGFLCGDTDVEAEKYLFRRAGFNADVLVFLCKLSTGGGECDPYAWNDGSRTMQVAHNYITNNWRLLNSGDVICVEHILGERATPKVSERIADYD